MDGKPGPVIIIIIIIIIMRIIIARVTFCYVVNCFNWEFLVIYLHLISTNDTLA